MPEPTYFVLVKIANAPVDGVDAATIARSVCEGRTEAERCSSRVAAAVILERQEFAVFETQRRKRAEAICRLLNSQLVSRSPVFLCRSSLEWDSAASTVLSERLSELAVCDGQAQEEVPWIAKLKRFLLRCHKQAASLDKELGEISSSDAGSAAEVHSSRSVRQNSPACRKVIWQDVTKWLIDMMQQGQPFSSYRELANSRGCAPNTIKKVIKDSSELKEWRKKALQQRAEAKRLRSANLTNLVMQQAPSPQPEPSDGMERVDADAMLARLTNELSQPGRARFHKLSEAQRLEIGNRLAEIDGGKRDDLVKSLCDQLNDPESILPEDGAPPVRASRLRL